MRVRLRGGPEACAWHAAKLGFGHRLRADGVFAFGGEIDELAGKDEAHDLTLAVGEGLVEPQQSPAHPVDVGWAIPLVKDVGILGEEAPMAMQPAASLAPGGARFECD